MGFSGVRRNDLQWTRRAASELDLKGTRAAIIGGTGGIGRAFARLLAARGADVIVVGQTFRDEGTSGLRFLKADLASMREAARVGSELAKAPLDLVVFTNGIMAAKQREVTAEGLERDMAVSYLSRLQLLRTLAPSLRAGTRVFIMGFPGTTDKAPPLDDLNAEKSYAAMPVHMLTVAGNEALVLDGVTRYPSLRFFGLNPGLIKTDIRSNFLGKGSFKHRVVEGLIGLLTPTPERYAERIVPLLVSADLDGHSGAMFDAKGRAIHASRALDGKFVETMIRSSEALVERAQQAAA